MTIQESLDRLVNILQSANEDALREAFPHIAEALEIDADSIDTENREAMMDSIREAVSNIEEDDVEAVVEEINQFFTEDEDEESESIEEAEKKASKDDDDDEDDEDDDDDDEMEEGSKKKKYKDKKESFYISASDLDVSEDVNALFHGEELTEELQEKAKTIFETAVVNKVNEKVASILEEYDDMIEEKTQEIEDSYAEKLDEYLDYVVNQWLEENKLAVESGIRSEMTESLMSGIRDVMEEHYVELPEEKVDMVENLQNKVSELEEGLNEALDQNAKLNRQLKETKKEEATEEITEGLSEMQREKLRELLETVEVEDDDEDLSSFRKRANIVRENYFPSEQHNLNEDNKDDVEPVDEEPDDSPVNRYAAALKRLSNSK